MSAKATTALVPARNLCDTYHISHDDLMKLFKEKKVQPTHSMPYGRGHMRLYDPSLVAPICEEYVNKRRARNPMTQPPAPAQGVTLSGLDAKLAEQAKRFGEMASANEQVIEALKASQEQLTQQNRALLTAMSKITEQLGTVLHQLGVHA